MNDFQKLIKDLESNDPIIRNESAIKLMDLGNIDAKKYLLNAINKLENYNNRGTLIYALSKFDCSDLFQFLIDLVFTNNYEVAWGASDILFSQKFYISDDDILVAKSKLNEYKKSKLPDFGKKLIKALEEFLNEI